MTNKCIYKRLYLKSGLHDVFWSFVIFNRDECTRTVFIPLHKTISNLLCQFYDYVSGHSGGRVCTVTNIVLILY